jgi:hypothetical protein
VDRTGLAAIFRQQADWCQKLGSPLYHDLLERAAADVEASGLCWTVLKPHTSDPSPAVLPLRFLGGIHRAVLEARAPELAGYYASGSGMADQLWTAFLEVATREAVPKSVQTNEVGRCCALLPGFIEISRESCFPLRLLEIGASGGLNLRWDRYRYSTPAGAWGDTSSWVRFEVPFDPGPLPSTPTVSVRRGCDLNPVDISNESGRLTLLSFIWPDQAKRLELVRGAIEIAQQVPASVEQADAVDWIRRELAHPVPGSMTVVFHSIVMLYLDAPKRALFAEILAEAGGRATPQAPLAWLSMERAEEPGESDTAIHLTLWPGGIRRHIAGAGFHGQDVRLISGNRQPSGGVSC